MKKGESLATFYASREKLFDEAERRYRAALAFGKERPEAETLIYARVSEEKVERIDIMV